MVGHTPPPVEKEITPYFVTQPNYYNGQFHPPGHNSQTQCPTTSDHTYSIHPTGMDTTPPPRTTTSSSSSTTTTTTTTQNHGNTAVPKT